MENPRLLYGNGKKFDLNFELFFMNVLHIYQRNKKTKTTETITGSSLFSEENIFFSFQNVDPKSLEEKILICLLADCIFYAVLSID